MMHKEQNFIDLNLTEEQKEKVRKQTRECVRKYRERKKQKEKQTVVLVTCGSNIVKRSEEKGLNYNDSSGAWKKGHNVLTVAAKRKEEIMKNVAKHIKKGRLIK